MDDLISRQAAIDALGWGNEWYMMGLTVIDKDDAIRQIKSLPSAQPERKKGKWVETEQPMGWDDVHCVTCSECGEDYILDEYTIEDFGWNFCPNCGADMRGEE